MTVFIVSHLKFDGDLQEGESKIYGGNFKFADEEYLNAITHDHFEDNISHKNHIYSELTSFYIINQLSQERNLKYVGLAHYRRRFFYFSSSIFTRSKFIRKKLTRKYYKFGFYLTHQKIEKELLVTDVILPQKVKRKMTNRAHFAKFHDVNDLDKAREVILKNCPEYIDSFDFYLNAKESHLFNMIIAKSSIIKSYCDWIFPILLELESLIDIKEKQGYQQRCMGYIAERLINVYFIKNNQFKIKEYPIVPEKNTLPGEVFVG